ncbi:hypothetical protein O3M35_004339 [Rhynocoris fuscipes]|uniref:Uncharacterized protein n=1 Tax=Rhynocoris fuscipes TaxID=488301 RepID=A0AAW1CGW0_9HEMI
MKISCCLYLCFSYLSLYIIIYNDIIFFIDLLTAEDYLISVISHSVTSHVGFHIFTFMAVGCLSRL